MKDQNVIGTCLKTKRNIKTFGLITIPESVLCRCGVPDDLCVSIFDFKLGKATHLKTFPVNETAMFEGEIEVKAQGALQLEAILHNCSDQAAVIYTRTGKNPLPKPAPAARQGQKKRLPKPQKIDLGSLPSQVICDVLTEAEFTLNYPDPYKDIPLSERLKEVFGEANISKLSDKDIELAACSCLVSQAEILDYVKSQKDLTVLQEAITQCLANHKAMEAQTFRSASEITNIKARHKTLSDIKNHARLSDVWFTLSGGANDMDLPEKLLISRKGFEDIISGAQNANRLTPLIDADKNRFIEGFAILRDCQHFPFREEGRDHDAQLIWLADIPLNKATKLFDRALDLGGLEIAINGGGLSANEKQRLEIIAECDDAFENYHALLKFLIGLMTNNVPSGALRDFPDLKLWRDMFHGVKADMWGMMSWFAKSQQGYRGYPENYSGHPDVHMNYGQAIESRFGLNDPTSQLIMQIGSDAPNDFGFITQVLQLNPNFDVAGQPAAGYFSTNSNSAKYLDPNQFKLMKTFQRLNKLAGDGSGKMNAIRALYGLGLTSSIHIHRFGRVKFMNARPSYITEAAWKDIYCRSVKIYDTAAQLSVQIRTSPARTAFGQNGFSAANAITAINTHTTNIPSLEDLFGGFDSCACEHCRSSLSYAAYIHYMLGWVEGEIDGAWDALISRRPDIPEILLSCENTNTEVKKIDLVNELLMQGLISPRPATFNTTLDSEELRIRPENDVPQAKRILANQFSTLALPFDASQAEAVGTLDIAGYSLSDIITILSPRRRTRWTQKQREAFAAASFNLLTNEFNFVANGDVSNSSFWPVYTSASASPSSNVGKTLSALNLPFESFKALADTNYIQTGEPGRTPFVLADIEFTDDNCSYDTAKFKKQNGNQLVDLSFSKDACDRVLRFYRLSEKAGIAKDELDAILVQYNSLYSNGAVKVSPDMLYGLACLKSMAGDGKTLSSTIQLLDDVLTLPQALSETQAAGIVAEYFGWNETRLQSYCHSLGRFPFDAAFLGGPSNASDVASALDGLIDFSEDFAGHSALFTAEIDATNFLNGNGELVVTPAQESTIAKIWETLEAELEALRVDAFDPITARNDVFDLLSAQTGAPKSFLEILYDTDPARSGWISEFSTHRTIAGINSIDRVNRVWSRSADIDGDDAAWEASQDARFKGFMSVVVWITHVQNIWSGPTSILEIVSDVLTNPALATTAQKQGAIDFIASKDFTDSLGSLQAASTLSSEPIQRLLLEHSRGQTGITAITFLDFIDFEITGNASTNATPLIADHITQAARLRELCNDTGTDLASYWDVAFPNKIDLTLQKWHDSSVIVGLDLGGFLRESLRKKRGDNQFEASQDLIRAALRDALVESYIKATPSRFSGTFFTSATDIYEFFLIDPEISTCMITSRLVMAGSAIQIFLTRIIMGLEPRLHADEAVRTELETLANYRVFEAKTKAWLFLHHYLDQDLRFEKTPLFEEAESALLQEELTDKSVERAINGYLQGLEKIAHLDVRAFCQDNSTEPASLDMILATKSSPYEHFYCRRDENGKWSPITPIRAELSRNIFMRRWHNRLWIFSPVITPSEDKSIQIEIDGKEQNAQYSSVLFNYLIMDQYSDWSDVKILNAETPLEFGHYAGPGVSLNRRRKLGQDKGSEDRTVPNRNFRHWKWRRNRDYPDQFAEYGPLTKAPFPVERHINGLTLTCTDAEGNGYADYSLVKKDPESLFFWTDEDPETGDLRIHARQDFSEQWETHKLGYVELALADGLRVSACNANTSLMPASEDSKGYGKIDVLFRPKNTLPKAQHMRKGLDRPEEEFGSNALYVKQRSSHRNGSTAILRRSPSDYVLTYPHDRHALWSLPFVAAYSDDTYFFERKTQCVKLHYNFNSFNGAFAGFIRDNDADLDQDLYKPQTDSTVHRQSAAYQAQTFWHPFVCDMRAAMNKDGLAGLYGTAGTDPYGMRIQANWADQFETRYDPVPSRIVSPYPIHDFNFSDTYLYGLNNKELFVHMNCLLAEQYASNGKFEKALHHLDMMVNFRAQNVTNPRDYWRVKLFAETDATTSLSTLLQSLSNPNASPTTRTALDDLERQMKVWAKDGFNFHLMGNYRPEAYMKWIVIKYIQILCDWGDKLFRQYTLESLNQATIYYTLALKLLGKKPSIADAKTKQNPKSYSELTAPSNIANSFLDIESYLTGFAFQPSCTDDICNKTNMPGFLTDPYFCIPHDDKISALWNRAEQNLSYLRSCKDIDGNAKALSLFSPVLDPKVIARALAAGLDIGDVLSQLASPAQPYRFAGVQSRAKSIAAEVKGLSAQLLSALNSRDAAQQAEIQAIDQNNLLRMTRGMKALQIQEAETNLEAMAHSLERAEISLEEYGGRELRNVHDKAQTKHMRRGQDYVMTEQAAQAVAGILHLLEFDAGLPVAMTKNIAPGKVAEALAKIPGMLASVQNFKGSMAGRESGVSRMQDDLRLNTRTGKQTVEEIKKQITMADIRLTVAKTDIKSHDLQMSQAEANLKFLREKVTGLALNSWMTGQLKQLLRRGYDMAFDAAKQAEKAYEVELGRPANIIQYGNWSSNHAGLLAIEALDQQLTQLDINYRETKAGLDVSEHSRTVALSLLEPDQILLLRMGQAIKFSLPEWLFNHRFTDQVLKKMRIKRLALNLTCSTGSTAVVPVRLRLVSSQIIGDDRQLHFMAGPEAKQIITSTALNDSGRFEPGLNGEQYLPFEGAGVISDWELELAERLEFDPATISDVLIKIEYTAEPEFMDKNGNLRQFVTTDINDAKTARFAISIREMLSEDWMSLRKKVKDSSGSFVITFTKGTTSTDIDDVDNYDVSNVTPYAYQSGDAPKPLSLNIAVKNDDGSVTYAPVSDFSNGSPTTKAITFEEGNNGVLSAHGESVDNVDYDGTVLDLIIIYEVVV